MSLLLLLLQIAWAEPKDCGERVRSFNEYEDKEKRRIVIKRSVSVAGPWNDHDAFDGFLTKADDEADELVLEFSPEKDTEKDVVKTAPLKPWKHDAAYHGAELDPRPVLNDRHGVYTVRLRKAGKILCESSFAVGGDD